MKTITYLLVLICICAMSATLSGQTVSNAHQADSLKLDIVPGRFQHIGPRSPFLSFSLCFIPAGGQFYNHQYGKAAAILGTEVLSIIIASSGNHKYIISEEAIIGTLGFSTALLYSFIDAPISSVYLNNKYHLKPRRKSSFNNIGVTPALLYAASNFTPSNMALGLKITIR